MFNSDIINFVLNINFENRINKTKTYYVNLPLVSSCIC